MARHKITLWMLISVIAITVQTVRADDQPANHQRRTSDAAKKAVSTADAKTESGATTTDLAQGVTSATVDRILERAVQNIAARYNLNDIQTEETDKMMKTRVHRFLREHENEVWPVIHKLLAGQLRPPEDIQEMKELGKAARPLLYAAKEAIFEANDEWGMMLTAEQKRVHEWDLDEMETQFEVIAENFQEWEAGQGTAENLFGQRQLPQVQPPRPPRPADGQLPENPAGIKIFDPNHILATLVEAFIKEYDLDKGQITTARSILEEFKGDANTFRESKKEELAQVIARQREALANRDLKGVKEARAEHKKLLAPVYDLCDEMEARLKNLLTTAQIQRHAEKTKSETSKSTPSKVTRKTSVDEDEGATRGAEPPPGGPDDSRAQADADKG